MKKLWIGHLIIFSLFLNTWSCSNGSPTIAQNKEIIDPTDHSEDVKDMKNDEFIQDYLLGHWKISKIIKYSWIMTMSKESAENLVHSEFDFTNDYIKTNSKVWQTILTESDQDTTPMLKDPQYAQNIISKEEFEADDMAKLTELGFNDGTVHMIEVYKDEEYENPWSLGYIYIDPATPNRSVISTNGVYLEIEKLS